MKRLLLPLFALACAQVAFARPMVIEQSHPLPYRWNAVAFAGDDAIAIAPTFQEGTSNTYLLAANLYHRDAAGQWLFVRNLAELGEPGTQWQGVAMNASTLAFVLPSGLHVFERTTTGWAESVLDVTPRPRGTPLDLHGNTILATEGGCATRALALNRGANGHWGVTGTLPVVAGTCISLLDLDANAAIVRSQVDQEQHPSLRIFERGTNGAWSVAATFTGNEILPNSFASALAIHGDLALASAYTQGAHVYRRGAAGWTENGRFEAPDGGETGGDGSFQITDKYILRTSEMRSRFSFAGYLFRERADHTFEHLAALVGNRDTFPLSATVDGDRVLALGGDFGTLPAEYQLPASVAVPALVQDDFEAGTGSWTPLPGSQFNLMNNGTTNVYRQSSLTGDAGAVNAADMTNQYVSADIRLNAVDGADRWVGLMTRYTDEANYYYVTVRDSNRVVLKRMVGGVFSELNSVPLDVAPGQTYRIGIESSGTYQTVDVEGRRLMITHDAALTHGRAGLRMYKAAADFDNVVVSPGPVANLVYASRETLGGTWAGTPTDFTQSSLAGDALRTSGLPREDAVVQAIVTVNSFAATGSAWAGLVARYQDADNFYYVTARKSNELSLRRLENGAITVLATVPLTVAPGTPFVLRLETVGNRLRVYVNAVLRVEQTGAQIVAGKVGAMTYRTAGRFEGYTAYEP
jgi:hypothetical protein